MQALRNLVLLVGVFSAGTASLAAVPDTTQPMTGQLLVARAQASVTTRMEYCLRNMPELTEPLVAAHAIYSRAAADAAAILERRFPASRVSIQRARIETSAEAAADFDLKQARSVGFNRLCPGLIVHMRKVTGETLAKDYGDTLSSLQKQFASN